jgi:pyruvate,water dikinase
VVEDGGEHSFAGVFESFLGVRGHREVLDAVRGCWASLFSHRALAYRLHAGLPHDGLAMAVGVVGVVSGRASGVGFSMHPVTGRGDRVVLEGAPGLGGAVLADGRTMERVEADKADGRVLRRESSGSDGPPLLSAREVDRIVDVVRCAENVFGHPVDVEWVLDPGGQVWVLQARPITATAPASVGNNAVWDPTVFLAGL